MMQEQMAAWVGGAIDCLKIARACRRRGLRVHVRCLLVEAKRLRAKIRAS
mgnify:CR=1 FL=1